MDRVRRASPEDLAGNDPSLIFEDEKLNDLLFRYRARNWPESLSASEKSEWLEHCKARLTTNTPATTVTLDEYRAGIDELAQDQKHAAKGPLFADLKAWADQLETRWAVKIPAAGRGLQPGLRQTPKKAREGFFFAPGAEWIETNDYKKLKRHQKDI